jgi:hypothetical protein
VIASTPLLYPSEPVAQGPWSVSGSADCSKLVVDQAQLITETLGVEVAPIEYVEDGRRHRVRIGDEVDITVEDFVPPQTPEGTVEQLVGMFHPANSTLTIARATASRVNAFGLAFDNTGKNGHSAPFSWAA